MKKSYVLAALLGGGLAIGVAAMTGRFGLGVVRPAAPAAALTPVIHSRAAVGAVVTAMPARHAEPVPDYARVVKVTPIRQVTSGTHAPCLRPATVPDEDDSLASSLADSLTGSVLDAMLGTSDDADNEAESLIQPAADATHPLRRRARKTAGCDAVLLASSRIVAYDIRYSLNGVEHTLRSKTRPAAGRLLVKNGQVLPPG